ncbi:unnamed protein product [Orchesella dallaii]|uniref:Uncharacterized protein n=1 Tax=Orchesella dallaii TaxID=48710 RepID=A0ABP1Q8Y2_9HEXA
MELLEKIIICFIACMIAYPDRIAVEPHELVESPLLKEIELKKSFLYRRPAAKLPINNEGQKAIKVSNKEDSNAITVKPARKLNSGTNSEINNVRFVTGTEEGQSSDPSSLSEGNKKVDNDKETPGKDRVFVPPYKFPFWGLPYGVYSNAGAINPGLFPFVPGGPGFPPFDGIFGGPFGPGAFPGKQKPFPPGVGTPMYPPNYLGPGQPPLNPTGNLNARKLKPGPPPGAYGPGAPVGYKKPPAAAADKPKGTKAPSKPKAKPKPKPKKPKTTPEPDYLDSSCPCMKSKDEDSPPPKYKKAKPTPTPDDSDDMPACPCSAHPPTPKKKKKKVVVVEDDDDDDDNDDIDDYAPVQPKKQTPTPCPFALKTPPIYPPQPEPTYATHYVPPPPPPPEATTAKPYVPPPPETTTAKPYVPPPPPPPPPETTTAKPYVPPPPPPPPPETTTAKPYDPQTPYPYRGYRRPPERDYESDSEPPGKYYSRHPDRDYESESGRYHRRPSHREHERENSGRHHYRTHPESEYDHEPRSRYYEHSPEHDYDAKYYRKRPRNHESEDHDESLEKEPSRPKSYEKDKSPKYGVYDQDLTTTESPPPDPNNPRPRTKCKLKLKPKVLNSYSSDYMSHVPEPTTTTTTRPSTQKPCPYKLRRQMAKYNNNTATRYKPVVVYAYPPEPESESSTNYEPATAYSDQSPIYNSHDHDHDHDLDTEASHSTVVYQPNPKDIMHSSDTSVTVPLPFPMMMDQSKSKSNEPNTVTYKLDLSEELLSKLTTPVHIAPQVQGLAPQLISPGNAYLVGGQPITIGSSSSMRTQQIVTPQQITYSTTNQGNTPQLVAPQPISYNNNGLGTAQHINVIAPQPMTYSSQLVPQVVATQPQPLIVLNSLPQHQSQQPQHLIFPPTTVSQPSLGHQRIVLNSPSVYDHQTSASAATVSYLPSTQIKTASFMQNYPSLPSSSSPIAYVLPESKDSLSLASKLVSPYQILSYPHQQQQIQQRRPNEPEVSRNYVVIDRAELAELRESSRSIVPENIPPPPEVVHISFHARSNEPEEPNKPLSFPDNYFITSNMPQYTDFNPASTKMASQFADVFDMNNMEGLLRSPPTRFRRGKAMPSEESEKKNEEGESLQQKKSVTKESGLDAAATDGEKVSKKIKSSAVQKAAENSYSAKFHVSDVPFIENHKI